MRDLIPQIEHWESEGHQVALATVISAWGSAPRPVGAKMAVCSSGEMAGSVSGGCVEGAVAQEATEVLSSGTAKVVSYGVSNDRAWSVGLSCGGRLDVLIEPATGSVFRAFFDTLRQDRSCARVISLDPAGEGSQVLVGDDSSITGSLGSSDLERRAVAAAQAHLSRRISARTSIEHNGRAIDVFIDTALPRPKLLIIGAVHVAIHLVSLARRLGYWTGVIDPRTAFATQARFSEADELAAEWPREALARISIDESTCLVFLSHDLKIDLPGLESALRSPALYIGALGSRKTHAKRVAELEKLGFSSQEISRIFAPIGLDLGGRRAEEIALAIMAEIVAVRSGGEVLRS